MRSQYFVHYWILSLYLEQTLSYGKEYLTYVLHVSFRPIPMITGGAL